MSLRAVDITDIISAADEFIFPGAIM